MANLHIYFLLAVTVVTIFGGVDAAVRRTKRQLQPVNNGVTVTETLDPNIIASIIASLQNPPGGTMNIVGAGLPGNGAGGIGGVIAGNLIPGIWPSIGGRPHHRPRPHQRPFYIQPIFIPIPIPIYHNINQLQPAPNNNNQLTPLQQARFVNQQQAFFNQLSLPQQQALLSQQALLRTAITNARVYYNNRRQGESTPFDEDDDQPETDKKEEVNTTDKKEEADSTDKKEEANSTGKKEVANSNLKNSQQDKAPVNEKEQVTSTTNQRHPLQQAPANNEQVTSNTNHRHFNPLQQAPANNEQVTSNTNHRHFNPLQQAPANNEQVTSNTNHRHFNPRHYANK